MSIKQSLPISLSFQLLATTNLLSVSMDLFILDISYKWNMLPLCLASFTEHHVFKVHSCWSKCFIPFYDWTIFHRMGIIHFIYLFISWISLFLSLFYPIGKQCLTTFYFWIILDLQKFIKAVQRVPILYTHPPPPVSFIVNIWHHQSTFVKTQKQTLALCY